MFSTYTDTKLLLRRFSSHCSDLTVKTVLVQRHCSSFHTKGSDKLHTEDWRDEGWDGTVRQGEVRHVQGSYGTLR